jgi:magnesium transporter
MVPERLFKEIRHHLKAVISRKSDVGKSLWKAFLEQHPADIAQFLSHLRLSEFKALLVNLPKEKMCAIFSELSETMQAAALASLNDNGKIDALSCLTTDEMTDLFENVSDEELKRYLNLLHKQDRERVLSLLKFESDSAGGIMDTDVLALNEDFTVKKSIELIQRVGVKKDLHRQIFVIDKEKRLVGNINLEDLVLHKPQARIKSFMKPNLLTAEAHKDQETIAKKMVHYNLSTVPVVGKDGYFLGSIPSTTLVDIIEEEASEDVYRMSAMEPVKGHYFEVSFWKLLYQRSYILIILLLAQSVSSVIIQHHEQLLAGFLVIFITMLISTGGNASSQTSAVIIQGMASGEINAHNMLRFFRRELMLACAMGLVLGVTAFGRVYITSGNLVGSLAVSSSLACIVVVSMSMGSVIPVILKRLNIDPAYSAGPFLATLMDILGLLIYCNISKLFIFS